MMLNILGDGSTEGTTALFRKALAVPGASLHWYGKEEAKKSRKMAHITFCALSLQELLERVEPFGLLSDRLPQPEVGIIMGSDSDLPTMKAAADILDELGVSYELTIVSAHRTPARLYNYAQTAADRGLRCIIAGAGGAAHLPGMCAAMTPLPVIGVPIKTSTLSGVDSLHSIVQMPRGIPVATVAIGNAVSPGDPYTFALTQACLLTSRCSPLLLDECGLACCADAGNEQTLLAAEGNDELFGSCFLLVCAFNLIPFFSAGRPAPGEARVGGNGQGGEDGEHGLE